VVSAKTAIVAVLPKKVSWDIEIFMKRQTRDLLLLRKDDVQDEKSIELEIAVLNNLLQHVETTAALCVAYELIDLNRFKILHDQLSISRVLKPNALKPFQFLVNRN
jgi:hypothetical protein